MHYGGWMNAESCGGIELKFLANKVGISQELQLIAR